MSKQEKQNAIERIKHLIALYESGRLTFIQKQELDYLIARIKMESNPIKQ